ncbi:MAG: DUF4178 domain-containing protein [Chitinophagaceae bacterium]
MSVTGLYSCPSCKAAVTFRAANTNAIICQQCRTPLERTDADVLQTNVNLKPVTDKIPGIIRLGTKGEFDGKMFEIIGRVVCYYEESVVCFWTMLIGGGSILMLAECGGALTVLERTGLNKAISFSELELKNFNDKNYELEEGRKYIVERKDNCSKQLIEGETWCFDANGFFADKELAAGDGSRLKLIYINRDNGFICFRMHYVTPKKLDLTGLRTEDVGGVLKEFACEQCKAVIGFRAFPLSQSFACPQCGARHIIGNNGIAKLRSRTQLKTDPAILLYSKGKLDGTLYEVIGYTQKEDAEGYNWREYTLFNAETGFAFLSEFNGNWIFLTEEQNAPVLIYRANSFTFHKQHYKLFNEYSFKITDCRGEFAENIFNDGNVKCMEYIAPPEMWIREYGGQGHTWYKARHITGDELWEAFGEDNVTRPYKIGMGVIEPVKGFMHPDALLRNTVIAFILFIVLFAVTAIQNKEQVLYENTTYFYNDTATTFEPIVAGPFKLDKWRSNIKLDVSAPVANDWLEVNFVLVNKDNGDEFAAEKGIEYYTGYEDGESWSEGSPSDDIIIPSVPRGNYLLQIYPSRAPASTVKEFTVKATYDIPMWRNFWLFGLMLMAPPIILMIYAYRQEGVRWENSPFSWQNE